MPTVDQRYIDRLDDFTKALEGIVELLKEDVARRNVDNVDRLLSNMNDDMAGVVKQIEIVVKSVKKIETQNDRILEEVKAARKAKETGMFGDVADVDNKRKIIDAIKVVTLITAGVLALGLAFKIISPVNFLSVIAIGLAIVFIAGAFVMVSAVTEGMTFKDVTLISGMMIVMATGLGVASWALAMAATISMGKMFSVLFTAAALGTSLVLMAHAVEKAKLKPSDYIKMALLPLVLPLIAIGIAVSSIILSRVVPMSFGQVMTTIFVATAIGTSLYLITRSLDKAKMEGKHVAQILLLPLIIPALALGLVISARILKGIEPISFAQMASAVFTALTVGILVYLMKPLIEKLKDFTLGQILLTTVLVAAIAAGLVVASWILGGLRFFSFREALGLILTSAAIGLAVLFLTPAIWILKSIKKEEMFQAATNVVIAAGAITVSSLILALGTYENYPDWRWTIGAGLSIIAFAGSMWLIKKMGLSYKEILEGGIAIIGISTVIMVSSWLLNMGSYDNYPGLEWSIGAGLSLVSFGTGMVILGRVLTKLGGAASAMAIGALAVLGVSTVIMLTSWILSVGNYETYPSFGWATGVGLSLVAFGAGMVLLGFILTASGGTAAIAMAVGALAVLGVAGVIVAVSYILAAGNYEKYPSLDWASGVGILLATFGLSMVVLGALFPLILLGSLSVGIIAKSIVKISNILAEGNYTNYPSKEWVESVSEIMKSVTSTMLRTSLIPNLLLSRSAEGLLIVAKNIVDISNALSDGKYTGGPTDEWAKGTIKILAGVSAASMTLALMWPFVSFGIKSMLRLSEAIVEASNLLSSGNYMGGPTEAWAKGVGGSILAFAKGIEALQESDSLFGFLFGENEGDKIVQIANAMKKANELLSSVRWSDNYPSEGWSKGVGNSILAFAQGIKLLDEADIDPNFEFIFAVTALSRGIIRAAQILNEFNWAGIKNYPSAEWSEGVGKAINAFAKPLAELGEQDITGRDITTSIRRLAKGIVEAAEIIGKYDWTNAKGYPTTEWAENVGKALGVFVKHLVEIEKNDIGRSDLRNLNRTVDAIISTAWKFRRAEFFGLWNVGPTEKWTNSIGKALDVFVKYLTEIEKKDIGRGDLKVLNKTIEAMTTSAWRFKLAEFFGGKDIWNSGPTESWSNNVGKSIGAFVKFLSEIEKNDIGRGDLKILKKTIDVMIESSGKFGDVRSWYAPSSVWSMNIEKSISAFTKVLKTLTSLDNLNLLDRTIQSMIRTSIEFGNIKKWSSPPKEWTDAILSVINAYTSMLSVLAVIDQNSFDLMDGVSSSIINFVNKIEDVLKNKDIYSKGGLFDIFSESMKKLTDNIPTTTVSDNLNTFGDALFKISNMGLTTSQSIQLLSKSLVELSNSLKNVDMSSVDKLSKFSNGILVLSLIDEKKLEDAVAVLDRKRNDIVSILSDNNTIRTRTSPIEENIVYTPSVTEKPLDADKNKFYQDILTVVRNIDTNISIMTKYPSEQREEDIMVGNGSKINTDQTNQDHH